LAAGAGEGSGQLGPRELPAQGWGRRHLEHGQGVAAAHLGAEGGQRPRVELSQQAAELVDLPSAGPDQALVGAGQDLDRLGQLAVAGDGAVVVPVGPDQVGQDLGIGSIGLAPEVAWRSRSRLTASGLTAYTW
jgi:hypothetical protein